MQAFIMPYSLDQLETRLWNKHILNIVLQTFITQLQRTFSRLQRNTLFPNLQNLSFITVSDDYDNYVRHTIIYPPIVL
jgi:hypothetical protein